MGKQQKKRKKRDGILALLCESFADIEEEIIREIYVKSNYNFDETVEKLQTIYNPNPNNESAITIDPNSEKNAKKESKHQLQEDKHESNIQKPNEDQVGETKGGVHNAQPQQRTEEQQQSEISFIKSLFSSTDEEIIESAYNQSSFEATVEFLLSSQNISLISSQEMNFGDEDQEGAFDIITYDSEINYYTTFGDNNNNNNTKNNIIMSNVEDEQREGDDKGEEAMIMMNDNEENMSEGDEEMMLNNISDEFEIDGETVKELYHVYQKDLNNLYHFLLSIPQQSNDMKNFSKKHQKLKRRHQKRGIPLSINSPPVQNLSAWNNYRPISSSSSPFPSTSNHSLNESKNNNVDSTSSSNLQVKSEEKDLSFSERLKYGVLKERYPYVERDVLFSIFQQNEFKIEASQAALDDIYSSHPSFSAHHHPPSSKLNFSKAVGPSQSTHHSTKPKSQSSSPTSTPPAVGGGGGGSNKPCVVGGVMNAGKGISVYSAVDIHQNNRKNAVSAMENRNLLYRQAARAYASGNGQLAASLSAKGKMEENKINQLNLSAARSLFHTREVIEGKSMVKVDVHGYRVVDAMATVKELISLARNYRSDLNKITIFIITGEGRHSVAQKAKIKPAVTSYFQSMKYPHKEVQGGVIVYI